jgi:glycosyltransferase involved in cell wall biosynthesis
MPVFNGAGFLQPAMDSLRRQSGNIQIIVVNDGSTDNTRELLTLQTDSLTIIDQPHMGPPIARNAGLRSVAGDYVAFIDADDLWTDGRLSRQLNFMQNNPDVDVLQERIQHIRLQDGDWLPSGEPVHAMSLSAALFRSPVFDKVGLLDESMFYCDDLEWFMRAKRRGARFARGDEVALLYRRHGHNLTNQKEEVNRYTLRAILKNNRAPEGDAT